MANIFESALQHAKAGHLHKAWNILVLNTASLDLRELHLMLDIALLSKQKSRQEESLQLLIDKQPLNYQWTNQLALLYFHAQQFTLAVGVIKSYLLNAPKNASAWFNLAYMSKFTGDHNASIKAYEKALMLNIESPEEAHCNIGNIYSQELLDVEKAKYHYTKALELNISYVQAKFNLAGLLEREGKLAEAGEAFVACADYPDYRLKGLTRALELIEKDQDKRQIAKELERFLSVQSSADISIDTVDALFSLGRFYESAGLYNDSWRCYEKANKLDAEWRTPASVKESLDQCELIKDSFDFCAEVPSNDTELVFICGLFRSGSTLLESMLATHPNLISGGEIDVFRKHLLADSNAFSAPLLLKNKLATDAVTKYLTRISEQTNSALDTRELRILDKQPENFLLLGYIKKLFPKAKFIWTCREKSNSVFSIYTQHFGFYQPYSCDLSDICTFYQQHLDLLAFWQQFYADDIKVVKYEDLVSRPSDVMSEIQQFLGVSVDSNFDKFYKSQQLVSTASMTQVRKPLHKNAINRVKPYLKWMNL